MGNQLELFRDGGGDYFYTVDAKHHWDFLVYNQYAFKMTNEEIMPSDLIPLKYRELTPTLQRLKSEAWSCGCKWFFVMQDEGIYLMNVFNEHFWLCRKHSYKFTQMYLDAPVILRNNK